MGESGFVAYGRGVFLLCKKKKRGVDLFSFLGSFFAWNVFFYQPTCITTIVYIATSSVLHSFSRLKLLYSFVPLSLSIR
jgi:hypothetical protein